MWGESNSGALIQGWCCEVAPSNDDLAAPRAVFVVLSHAVNGLLSTPFSIL